MLARLLDLGEEWKMLGVSFEEARKMFAMKVEEAQKLWEGESFRQDGPVRCYDHVEPRT